MLEKTLELKVCNYAENLGWFSIKLSSPSVKGLPDRMFLRNNKVIFVEFKSKNGILSPLQKFIIKRLSNENFIVHVINDLQQGKDIFDQEEPTSASTRND